MSMICAIVLAWFALSLPLAVLMGKSIKLGMEELKQPSLRRPTLAAFAGRH
jgi:hypothetical protein